MKTLSVCGLAFLAALAAQGAVYELQLSVKTTAMKEGKIGSFDNVCNATGKVAYRKETTQKIKGVVWGSECEADCGGIFWNDTLRRSYISNFGWEFLNRIDSSGRRAEGFCQVEFSNSDGSEAGQLWLAGFGAVKDDSVSKDKSSKEYDGDYSHTYLNGMSGSLVGWFYLNKIIRITNEDCTRCAGGSGTETVDVAAWALCSCDEVNDARTAAHGTWSMKYNAKASEKLEEGASIDSVYSFPKYIAQ